MPGEQWYLLWIIAGSPYPPPTPQEAWEEKTKWTRTALGVEMPLVCTFEALAGSPLQCTVHSGGNPSPGVGLVVGGGISFDRKEHGL